MFESGDYCLFTRWGDGMPNDPWYVGFYEKLDNGRHKPMDHGRAFQHCCKITQTQGAYIVENSADLENAGVCLFEAIESIN